MPLPLGREHRRRYCQVDEEIVDRPQGNGLEPALVAPGEELGHGFGVCRAGMRVANLGREELDHALGDRGPGPLDDRRQALDRPIAWQGQGRGCRRSWVVGNSGAAGTSGCFGGVATARNAMSTGSTAGKQSASCASSASRWPHSQNNRVFTRSCALGGAAPLQTVEDAGGSQPLLGNSGNSSTGSGVFARRVRRGHRGQVDVRGARASSVPSPFARDVVIPVARSV